MLMTPRQSLAGTWKRWKIYLCARGTQSIKFATVSNLGEAPEGGIGAVYPTVGTGATTGTTGTGSTTGFTGTGSTTGTTGTGTTTTVTGSND
eukprot:UN18436